MTTPLCSIVIPTRDRPEHLRSCLESLARLEYPRDRFEVIVVDDGSRTAPDPSKLPDGPDLKVVSQANAGPAAARNTGAEHAAGELLVFTDDDCRPRPQWLARLAARAAENGTRAVGGRVVNGLHENPYADAAQVVIDVGHGWNRANRDYAQFFSSNNLAVPVAAFRAVGGFDPSFRTSEDRDFCARWLAAGYGLTFEPDAVVDHYHDMGLAEFARVHFGYGRGAFRYHRKRGGVSIAPGYYAAVAAAPLRRGPSRRSVALAALLAVWHAANTAGYAYEWARSGRRSRGRT